MRLGLVAVFLCCLVSCGYIGPVVPPSPQIPFPITDLAVVERGNQLIITFSTPARTIDALPIERFSEIDLRVGSSTTPFNLEQWEAGAQQYALTLSEENDPEDPHAQSITKKLPVAEWEGKNINVAVRTAAKKGDTHYSQWSNRVKLMVIPPLAKPQVGCEATREGYRLTWPETVPGANYDVLRQGPGEKTPVSVGVAEKPEYVDTTALWDTAYLYTVIAKKESAESLPSLPVQANSPDKFAPSIPANVVALAGPDSVEVSWTRSPEPDTKGYYVFRSINGAPFQRQGELVTLPTFSDRQVEHGKTYRYAISAVDQKNNISERSTAADTAY